jgi:hypothetical protein
VVKHAEQCWRELLKHLDDKRYCITLETMSGAIQNFTVGDICQIIIARTLSEAYYQKLAPETVQVYARLRTPQFGDDKKKLQAWCEEHSKRKLYELQVEMCRWAIAELQRHDIPDVSTSDVKEWTTAIEAQIKSLNETKRAVPFAGFGSEEFIIYGPK